MTFELPRVSVDPVPLRTPRSPGSPEWWRDRLGDRLSTRAADMLRLQAYYDGKHPLAFASPKFREAFGGLFRSFADNFTPLVVDAVLERLTVTGFRLGREQDPQTGAVPADDLAWAIWQRNGLDASSELLHQEALIKSEASAIVWHDERDPSLARITVEDPTQVVVDVSAGDRTNRRAALKRWVDDDGLLKATLYLPDAIYKWQSRDRYQPGTTNVDWRMRQPRGETWPVRNPLGVVPVIPFVNRPRLLARADGFLGQSEIANVLPIQDAINKLVADMLVAAEFAAYRQRYILNLDLEIDEATGQPRKPFTGGQDRLMILPSPDPDNPNAKEIRVGEFEVSDLRPYIGAVEMFVQHVATQTRTPAHYLLGQSGSFPSGESLKATETGLVAKARQRMRHYGESWEEAMRVAFLVEGDERRAAIVDSETIWDDPEYRSEAEHTDAIVKQGSDPIGVPREALWEALGYTPTQIARFRTMADAEALRAATAADPFAGVPDLRAGGPSSAADQQGSALSGLTPARPQVVATNGNGRGPADAGR